MPPSGPPVAASQIQKPFFAHQGLLAPSLEELSDQMSPEGTHSNQNRARNTCASRVAVTAARLATRCRAPPEMWANRVDEAARDDSRLCREDERLGDRPGSQEAR